MERHIFIIQRIAGITLMAVGVFLLISLLTHSPIDPPDSLVFPTPHSVQNWCGQAGATASSFLFNAVGYSAYVLLIPLITGIVFCWKGGMPDQILLRGSGFLLILLGLCGLSASFLGQHSPGPMIGPGGYLGVTVHTYLKNYFAIPGSTIIYTSFLIAGMFLSCDYSLLRLVLWTFGAYPLGDFIVNFFQKRPITDALKVEEKPRNVSSLGRRLREQITPEISEAEPEKNDEIYEEEEEYEDDEKIEEDAEEEEDEETDEDTEEEPAPGIGSWLKLRRPKKPEPILREEDLDDIDSPEEETVEYELPSIEHLMESEPYDYDEQEKVVQRQAKLLEKAFADYGFNIKVVEIQTGPVISQFEVQLERGLRLNKIMGLTDDLAVTLKVPTVRIVAPIPGKNTVGVEVPNPNRQIVRLRDVMEESAELIEKMAIPIFLGKDVAGNPMVIDMAKMPHLLIAGRTGTGKSVCLNSIIVSMLMTRRPDECRMIMIDPKMVELSPYKTIPHLMHPVVTDMQKAEAILAWAVDKMEIRYQVLARAGVRQLSEFNSLTEEELYRRVKPESDEEWETFPRSLPYLVIIADEMADLMMTAAKEVETHIIRIAQKSRAVGIHLILATQKPTVDIITGLIKSNLPARIAFEVASQTDSRVVIDRNGAEKLLGNGDMLFLQPGTSQVLRGQGTYVSDKEIDEIIGVIGTEEPDYITELVELKGEGEDGNDGLVDSRDELYNDAVEYVLREGRGSLSLLQRKFKIGYGRAARLIDFMAEDGIVGAYNGSQAREVLISVNEWRKRMAGGSTGVNHVGGAADAPKEVLGPIKTLKPKLVPVKPAKDSVPPVKTPPKVHPLVQELYQDEEDFEDTPNILPMSEPVDKTDQEEGEEDDEEYEYVYEEWDGEENDEDAEYEYVEYEEDEEFEDEYDDEYEEKKTRPAP